MADLKISALTSASTPLAGTEVLPIVQSSATKKVTVDDLTVKNVRSNSTTGLMQITGPAAGQTRVMTTPNANFTVARTDAAQTFTGTQKLASGFLTDNGTTGGMSNGVPLTIFALNGAGLYTVMVVLVAGIGVSAAYTAFATVAFDGVDARISSNNGANLTITLSGTNVQTTQTSGGFQPLGANWSYSKISLS